MNSSAKLILVVSVVTQYGCAMPTAAVVVPDNVSLIQLLVNPDQYKGKVISVAGFLSAFGNELYLTENHYQLVDGASSIGVGIAYGDEDVSRSTYLATGCENQYVRVDGTFGEFGWAGYAITYVYQIYEQRDLPAPGPPRVLCWENTGENPFYSNVKN